ncbi:MAG: isoprenyl transferase [Phycisphaerae bacterium]
MKEPPLDPRVVLGLEPHQLPRHIAIIMDGNGRWAMRHGLPRVSGHAAGARAVRAIVTECARLGLACLTLYSFSTENWKRPRDEVEALMQMYAEYLVAERETILSNNVRLVQIGRREGLPDNVLRELDTTVALSRSNTGLTLCLALNYGSRQEILEAARRLAREVRDGQRRIEDIDEAAFSNALYTAGMPDPDLLVRTANERRISNFLLWQISYAEIHVTPVLWPDFGPADLHEAIRDFAARQRRFGGLAP